MNLIYLTLEAARNGQAAYTHIHEIIAGLKKRGWSIDLYQPSYAFKEKSPPLILRLFHSLWVQIRLWSRYKRGSIIYVRAHYLAFPTALIASALRIPVVHEINGPYEDVFVTYPSLRALKNILICIMKNQYKLGDILITVTDQLASWAQAESGKKPYVVPNAANPDIFHPKAVKHSDDHLPRTYALFYGGLTGWHGIPVILRAFESPEWPKDVHLVFIGEGPEKQQIINAAAKNPGIHYLGKKNYTDIPSYIVGAVCGLVAMSNPSGRSSTGLYPLKLFETLACGVPVIVTDFPGQADLVRDGHCGIVIQDGDHEALAKAVSFFATNDDEQKHMGDNGANLIREHHSWDARAAQTHDILMTLKQTTGPLGS